MRRCEPTRTTTVVAVRVASHASRRSAAGMHGHSKETAYRPAAARRNPSCDGVCGPRRAGVPDGQPPLPLPFPPAFGVGVGVGCGVGGPCVGCGFGPVDTTSVTVLPTGT